MTRTPRLVAFLPPLVVAALASGVAACGDGDRLVGYDVALTTTSDCTVTGQAARNCVDDATLAQTVVHARWIVEPAADGQAFTLHTDDGASMPGLSFRNDGTVLNAPGCTGEGGTCLFARVRTESIDPRENNCRRFTEHVVILHRLDDASPLSGITSQVAGNDDACGTPSANELVHDVQGTRVDEPVLARETP